MTQEPQRANVVFVFAHQDDEYGVLPTLEAELSRGRRAHCIYLTSGNGKGVDGSTRDRESLEVLTRVGVAEEDVHFFGSERRIDDGRLAFRLDEVFSLLEEIELPTEPHRIYTMAWEGGHADHDAAHLIALALARRLRPAEGVWEFSLYNGFGVPWRFFRVMQPLRSSDRKERIRLSFSEGLRYALTCFAYRSQRKTWIGLFPEAFLKYVVLRRSSVSPALVEQVTRPPHSGKLLYERMFGVTRVDFEDATRTFIAEKVLRAG